MKITSFKELLLKKTEGNSSLQTLIKNTNDDFFSEQIIEALEKMAEDKRRPRSSNRAVQHFGDYSLDETGDTANMVHDALSHHASHYKAAINSDQKHLASQHMKKIHNIMHFSRKLGHDGTMDHGGGKLKIEAVDPKPWERSGFPKTREGKIKKFVTDTKGWSRDGGSYEYMQMEPHESYAKEVQGHGHKGAYPLEEIKVNGKHLHIDDKVNAKGYEGHAFDEHPIIKSGMYKKSPQSVDDSTYDNYLKDLDDYHNSEHLDKYYDKHEKLQSEDPDGYAARGANKPDPIITKLMQGEVKKPEAPATEPVKEEPKTNTYSDVHNELTDEERNHPENKKLLDAINSGAFNLDKDTVLNIIRGRKDDVKKSLTKIKESLVKNKDFLRENPEILEDIKSRLVKAIDDETSKWLKENDPEFSEDKYNDEDENVDYNEDGAFGESELADLFDKPEDDAGDFEDEDKHLVEAEKPELVDINEADKVAPAKDEPIKEEPVKEDKRGSGYAEWKPRDDYSPEQQKKIDEYVAQGYHPGDAEMLIGASKKHTTMRDAVKHKVHPHDMSTNMHDKLRELADLHMGDVRSSEYSIAEPELNPQKATAGSIKNYTDIMQDFRDKKSEYENSDEFKGLSPRERHKARKEWTANYHKENPEHEAALKQEWKRHGETDKENWEKRKDRLDEGRKSIAQAGQMDTEGTGSLSSGSQQMAAGPEGSTEVEPTMQAAYQSAGISAVGEGESITGTTIKDPHATFAEKNPELTAKYKKNIESSLDDAGKDRLKRIDALKGK